MKALWMGAIALSVLLTGCGGGYHVGSYALSSNGEAIKVRKESKSHITSDLDSNSELKL